MFESITRLAAIAYRCPSNQIAIIGYSAVRFARKPRFLRTSLVRGSTLYAQYSARARFNQLHQASPAPSVRPNASRGIFKCPRSNPEDSAIGRFFFNSRSPNGSMHHRRRRNVSPKHLAIRHLYGSEQRAPGALAGFRRPVCRSWPLLQFRDWGPVTGVIYERS